MTKARFVSGVAILGLAASAPAAVYSLSANVSNIYAPDFSSTLVTNSGKGSSVFLQNTPSSGVTVFQIDLYVSATGLEAGKRSIGNLAMDISMSAGVTQDSTLPGWWADYSNTDTNGSAPGGGAALWGINGDQGAPEDLRSIVVSTTVLPAPTAFDFRAKVGIPSAATAFTASIANDVNAIGWTDGKTYLGSVYLDVPGTSFYQIIFDLTGVSYQDSSTGALVLDQGAFLNDATVRPPFSEPGSLSLLGVDVIGLFGRRRL